MRSNRVLITGASSGLGWYLSLEFAKNGHDLLITGRNRNRLVELATLVKQYNIDCLIIEADLGKKTELDKLIKSATAEAVDILINNAGILCIGLPFFKIDAGYIEEILKVNLFAPILLTSALKKSLNHLININSVCGLELKTHRALYCTSKWGLRVFSDSLKKEETGLNILDVYPSKLAKQQADVGIKLNVAAKMVYNSYCNKENTLLLDGRGDK
jgi:uncharacterized protein